MRRWRSSHYRKEQDATTDSLRAYINDFVSFDHGVSLLEIITSLLSLLSSPEFYFLDIQLSTDIMGSEVTAAAVSHLPVQMQVNLGGKIIASMHTFFRSSICFSISNEFTQLVTGANRGIGLGIAECCLANGASKVYSIDYADDVGDDFKTLSKVYPGQLFALKADVTKEQSITEAIDKVLEEAGALHGVVVNAGRTNHKSALEFTTEEIEALFAVNVSSHLPLSQFSFMLPPYLLEITLSNAKCSFSEPSTLPASPLVLLSNKTSRGALYSQHRWLVTAPTKSSPRHHTVPRRVESAT